VCVGQNGEPDYGQKVFTRFDIRSAHIWRCAGRLRRRFRNWRVIKTFPQPNCICISICRRLRALFGYSTSLHQRGQWRADGNMVGADEKAPVFTGAKWWRRRESNPRPKIQFQRTLHACPLFKVSHPVSKSGRNHRVLSADKSHSYASMQHVRTSPLYDTYPRLAGTAKVSALLN